MTVKAPLVERALVSVSHSLLEMVTASRILPVEGMETARFVVKG